MMERRHSVAIFLFITFPLLTFGNTLVKGQDSNNGNSRPNFLIIVADDLGFSDIGPFGSEISTPNLDALARDGKVFSNFHVLPMCSPTRSELLTGVDNHLNGLGAMSEVISPGQEGKPGYETYLNDKVNTIAEVLNGAGYHSIMSGKWHLSGPSPVDGSYFSDPSMRGFEKSFTLLGAMANHFNGACLECGQPIFLKNGKLTERQNGTYSSDLYTDEMIRFINEVREDNRPLFMYLSFQVTHHPFEAPTELIKKYSDKYSHGWDHVRQQRFDKQIENGIWPSGMELTQRFPPQRHWIENINDTNALYGNKQEKWMENMAIDAAMIDNMDYNVGKLVSYLKKIGEFDSTFILFTSDNGGVNPDIGINSASLTPLSGFKGTMYEGGIRSPLIVKPPYAHSGTNNEEKAETGEVIKTFTHVLDVVPTLIDYAGAQYPSKTYRQTFLGLQDIQQIYTPSGKSMRPLLEGDSSEIYGEDKPFSQELFGNGAVFMGDWKAMRHIPPVGNGKWELYNITADPVEVNNLAPTHPDILRKLSSAYDTYAREVNVLPSDMIGMPLALYGTLPNFTYSR